MKRTRAQRPDPATLKPARPPRELSAQDVDLPLTRDGLKPFRTTAEIEPLDEIIGQQRAMESLELGLGISQEGYNIFVAGLTGTGKMETISRSLQQKLPRSQVPDDWVYVHNFENPDEPWAIRLQPGQGRQLKRDMKRLVEQIGEALPKAFRQEDFNREKEQLTEKYHGWFQQQMKQLADRAKELGFEIREAPAGNLVFVPLINGKPPESEDALRGLSDAEKQRIAEGEKELAKEAVRIMRIQRDLIGELSEEVRAAERRFGTTLIEPFLGRIRESYRDHERVRQYLDRVAAHLLDHLADFRSEGPKPSPAPPGPVPPAPGLMAGEDRDPEWVVYQVNVVVDHSGATGAPIVVEEYPTYRNLFGTIDRIVEPMGRAVTNFTQIKAGSLLRANGGYLVFNLEDALTEPQVYKNLKRVLKTGRLRLESYDPFGWLSASGLRPEAIPVNTKVVVVGSPWLYLMLRFYDDEFASIFKIKAEFGTEMERGQSEQWLYARFVAMLARDEKLRPFDRDAVIEVIRFGSRGAAHQEKLLTRFSEVADVLREGNYFAAKASAEVVGADHIRQALHSRVYRSDRIAGKIRELMADGTLLIDVAGRKVGQINGLAVADLGDYAFGRPSRVTVAVGLGSEGVVNIEREAKLSGSTHDKGVLILAGYLRNQYGQDKPLTLSASLCFEQSYGGIDGDSASSTELYALLSLLAEVPLRQDIAVTGSINQFGQIQAIGGVIEKVEGFYDVCREIGWTGQQGVCIPASNVRNLVLRDDVRQAVADGQFHVYPIQTIDEGLELLGGIQAGTPAEEGTFHWLVDQRLQAMAEALRNFDPSTPGTSVLTARQEIPPHLPPKLPDDNP